MKRLIVMLMAIVFITGCAAFAPVIKPETPKEAYLVALTEYNNLLELYVKNKPLLQDEDLKAEAAKLFKNTSDILDVWLLAVDSNIGVYEGQIRASQAMSQLTDIIIKVLEVTK